MKKKILAMFILGILIINYCLPILAYNTNELANKEIDEKNITSQKDLKIKGINSFGALLAGEIANNNDENQRIDKGCDITNVEIEGTKATVFFRTKIDVNIIVGIYDDSGTKLIATGNKGTYANYQQETIYINIDEMPEYFFIRAFMVDDNLNPLCNAYESPKYTKYMQELLEMKTDDFNPERVLNLNEDNTTNFAIYGENTILIEEIGNTNVLKSADQENQIYVFENIDSKIKGLKKADKFSYKFKDGNVLLINVGSISISDTTATITGNTSKLQDYFDYVKIEARPTEDDYKLVRAENENIRFTNTKGNGQLSNGKKMANDVTGTHEYTLSLTFDGTIGELKAKSGDNSISDSITMEGSIEGKLGIELLCYVNKENQYITYNQQMTLSVDVSISANVSVKIPLVHGLKINTLNIVEIDLTPYVCFDVSAGMSLSQKMKEEISIIFNNGSFTYSHTKPQWNTDYKISRRANAFIGIECSPKIKITDYIVLKCTNKLGANIEAKDIETNEEHIHTCENCICGQINFTNKIEPSFKLFLLEFKDTKELKIKLFDFHYSFDHNRFEFNTCPNITYKVTAIVKQFDGKLINGATIKGTYLDSNPVTDETGKVEFYLPNGNYSLKGISDSGEIVKKIKVESKPVYVEFVTEQGYDEARKCHYGFLDDSDVRWEFYEETGKLYILGNGEMPYDGHVPIYLYVASADGNHGWAVKELTIGAGITGIAPWAFNDCKNLEKVSIAGNSLLYIGDAAFKASGIKKIKFPETVRYIGNNAFDGCGSLEEINIPEGVRKIGSYTFNSCHSLKEVSLPNTITQIGDSAFASSGIENIQIPNKTKRIGDYAFGNSKLKEIIIPDSVEKMGDSFRACEELEKVKISNKIDTIKAQTFAGCKKLSEIEIPESVKKIQTEAFAYCTSLYEITIPGVEFIADNVFLGCYGLRYINIPRNAGVMENSLGHVDWLHSWEWCDAEIRYISKINVIDENLITKFASINNGIVSDVSYLGRNDSVEENITKGIVEDLIPGEDYVITVVKEWYGEDLLDENNLIYITQMKADENGKIEFLYEGNEEEIDPEIVAFGISKVKRITLDQEKVNIEAEQKYPLITKIYPKNVVDSKIIWTSSDTKIAKVSEDGEIEGISDGIAEITAKIGDVEAKCKVVVGKSILGDVNGDDKVTLADCTKILAHVKKTKLLTEEEQKMADVNGDGKVTLADYTKVLAHVKKTKLLE